MFTSLVVALGLTFGLFWVSFIVSKRLRHTQGADRFMTRLSWKLLFSLGPALLLAGWVAWGFTPEIDLSLPHLYYFHTVLTAISASIFAGLTLGWGKTEPDRALKEPSAPLKVFPFSNRGVAEYLPDGIRITIPLRKNWGGFLRNMGELVLIFLFLPLIGNIFNGAALGNISAPLQALIIMGIYGLCLLVMYYQAQLSTNLIAEWEIITVNQAFLRIEKAGRWNTTAKFYRAEQIKSISTIFEQGHPSVQKSRKAMPDDWKGLIVYLHGAGIFRPFGIGVCQKDAQMLLDLILNRYPQYRGA